MKKTKIPDWWRCKNCKYWRPYYPDEGWCANNEVDSSVTGFDEDILETYPVLFNGDRFGCIHFESRDESNEN